jgi:hypothetical protein
MLVFSDDRRRAMTGRPRATNWSALQAKSHDPEVQALIAEAIARGLIRVVPAPDGGIRIIPRGGDDASSRSRPSFGAG